MHGQYLNHEKFVSIRLYLICQLWKAVLIPKASASSLWLEACDKRLRPWKDKWRRWKLKKPDESRIRECPENTQTQWQTETGAAKTACVKMKQCSPVPTTGRSPLRQHLCLWIGLSPFHLRRHDRTMWRCDLGFPVSSRSKVVNAWFNIWFQYISIWFWMKIQPCLTLQIRMIRVIPSFGGLGPSGSQNWDPQVSNVANVSTCVTPWKELPFPRHIGWPDRRKIRNLLTGKTKKFCKKIPRKPKEKYMDQEHGFVALEALHPV